jgi:hypothetical protein
MPEENQDFIDLPENVVEELRRRQQEQQEKYRELLELQQEFENLNESNQDYLQGIGDINGVDDIENYQVVEGGMQRVPEEQRQQQMQQAQEVQERSSDLETAEAVSRVEQMDLPAAQQFVGEDEDRSEVLQALVQKQ